MAAGSDGAASGGTQPSSGGAGGTRSAGGALNSGGGSVNVAGSVSPGGSENITGGAQSAGASNTSGGSVNTGGAQSGGGGGGAKSLGGALGNGGMSGGNAGGARSSGGASGSATGGASGSAGSATTLRSSSADPTYATAGAWHGYIWPAIESGGAVTPGSVTTISPTAATGFRAGGPPYCVTGHVPATTNSTSVAMIGMNTNQERSGGAVAAQWTATGVGILVNVSNPGGSPLRLQIQTNETGAIATLWCAMLTVFDQTVVIPWSDFNTKCWNNSGTAYDQGAGIATVMVLVPGTAQTGGYDFDFCVNDLGPA